MTAETVEKIIELRNLGYTYAAIAAEVGMSKSAVNGVCVRKWLQCRGGYDDWTAVADMYENGMSVADISKETGVPCRTIYNNLHLGRLRMDGDDETEARELYNNGYTFLDIAKLTGQHSASGYQRLLKRIDGVDKVRHDLLNDVFVLYYDKGYDPLGIGIDPVAEIEKILRYVESGLTINAIADKLCLSYVSLRWFCKEHNIRYSTAGVGVMYLLKYGRCGGAKGERYTGYVREGRRWSGAEEALLMNMRLAGKSLAECASVLNRGYGSVAAKWRRLRYGLQGA